MFDIRAHDTTPPAPGDLRLVQRFMNLHEHGPDGRERHPPTEMLRTFLVEHQLLTPEERFTDADRETALRVYEALHAKVRANLGERLTDEQVATIDTAASAAGLHPHFGHDGPVLVPERAGVPAAIGRLVAVAFLADLDGSWAHLKECADDDCRSVFFDRSKNHSGRWCSMSSCGNRAKVRAWRERQRREGESAPSR